MINPHAPFDVAQPHVRGQPVLVALAVADQMLEQVVAHLAIALGWADAGLVHGLTDHPGGRLVEGSLGVAAQAEAIAAGDRGHDAGPRRRIIRLLAIAQAHAISRCILEL